MSLRILILTKRYISQQDVLLHKFGRYYQIPKKLTEKGHIIDVFLIDQKHGPTVQIESDGIQFRSVSLLRSFYTIFTFISNSKPDLIVAGGNIHISLFAVLLSKHFLVPLVYDVYDQYPSFLPIGRSFFNQFHNLLLTTADGVTTSSQALSKIARQFNSKTLTIRNACDPKIFQKTDKQLSRRKLGLPEHAILIGYSGGLAPYVMHQQCLEAAESLSLSANECFFVHAGPPHRKITHPRYLSIGNLSSFELTAFINACDIVTAPYRNCEQVYYSNACKLSEYNACQAVAVASRNGDWGHYFVENYPGLFDPNETNGLFRAIQRQLDLKFPSCATNGIFWHDQADSLIEFSNEILRLYN